MAFIRLNMLSNALHGSTEVAVFCPYDLNQKGLPENYIPENGFPVLYLNHGGDGNCMEWVLSSNIYRTAMRKGLFIVMPTVEDQLSGRPYRGDFMKFVAEDLPEFMKFTFPISHRREDTAIAGLSYGGYFAYRIAMNYPDNYGFVGSFSSPVAVVRDLKYLHDGDRFYPQYNEIPGTNRDVLGMARKLISEGKTLPKMYQACGTEDFTMPLNIEARDTFRALGCDLTWEQGPGTHNFDFWLEYGNRFIEWLGLKDKRIERPPFPRDKIKD